MKKFLLSLLLVFAMLISATQAQSADVPNFRRVAGDSVRGGKTSNEIEGYHVYTYTLSLPLTYDRSLVEKYISLLKENGLTFIKHEEENFVPPDPHRGRSHYDYWFFHCKGHCVLFQLYQNTYSPDGYTEFSVKVANELTYEED